MLSAKERARIRLEEKCRRRYAPRPEVPPRRNAVIEFLNTSLGLFMLSTVFITFFSWGYNSWSEVQKAKLKRAETEKHLRLEIAYRLRIIHKLTRRFPDSDLNIIRTATYGFRVGSMQVPTHMLIYSPIFEEYGTRSLESLFWELESVVPEREKAPIRNARIKCFAISDYFDKLAQITEPFPASKDGSGLIYFYELPPADRSALEDQVFKHLGVFESWDA
jgi:hypothetical protein